MQLRSFLLAAAIACPSAGALAQSVSLSNAVRIDEARLGEIRGGFVSPQTGLTVSFGIERAVYVNGELAASTVVQIGAGNGIDAAALNSLTHGIAIQNSLDNQKVQAVTTLDVKATSLSTWNGMNLNSSVSNAITASLRR